MTAATPGKTPAKPRAKTPGRTTKAAPAAQPAAADAVAPPGPAAGRRTTTSRPKRAPRPAPLKPTDGITPVADDPSPAGALPVDADAIAPPRPAPRRPGLIPTDIADTIRPVLGKAVADIRAHEEGSRRGGDIENVHKMRVATRRIRAYLKAARPALDRVAVDRLRDDVRELAGTLGVLRDHDVMIDRLHTEASRLGEPDTAALEQLIARLDADRVLARRRLVAELDDPAYAALLTELDEAVATPPVADPWADLVALAAAEWRVLVKQQRRLQRRFGDDPPNDDLHDLRIYGKRARYAAELLPSEPRTVAFLGALAEFQEVLGDHQDACVLEDQLRELLGGGASPGGAADVDLAAAGIAAGRVIQGCRERRVTARADYPGAWKKVKAAGDAAFGDA
ncbi:CHAD domain-containing protein [Nakamurella flava]|uniref:CHAD domain-containing protein n=1 Tax=Nakamurella flava TaxID=2576308 RepID=A0A4U6QLX1_9ACTN|nr:CHAD domain-containing protein [Nakamurella flava]TKV61564.1 CHAD domain-containing protein [Nakamurella flava]